MDPRRTWVLARVGVALVALTTMWSPRADAGQNARARPLTFVNDVAPTIFTHCASCHRPGEAAPFSLLTYDEVRRRGQQIVEVVRSRYMPPWKPAAGFGGPFIGERRLTDREIATIAAWVEQGAPEGDPADLPQAPPSPTAWRLGTPDLVLTMSEPYTLPADGPDVFRNFVLSIPIAETKYIAGLELRPSNRVAHHANLRIDRTGSSRELDEQDPLPGYEGPISPSAQYPDGHFLGWTPGQLPPLAAKGMAWRLEPGSDLVVQIHMQPAGRPEPIQPSVGFFFTDDPPVRTPMMIRLGRQHIDIPPGESRYVVRDDYRLPVDVHVYGAQPHAHFRAKDVKGIATLPDGTVQWLIYIPEWDFNWQDAYRYFEPVFLPKGTTLSMEWTYDNSTANPRNPDRPPRRVLYGQNSTDEMGDLWLQVLASTPQDREMLFEDFRPKLLQEDAVGYETMLLASPQNAKLHDYLALIYWDLGELDRAITHYEAAVRFEPDAAMTRYNFATLLIEHRRFDEAVRQLRAAIALRPEHPGAHTNLAVALMSQGKIEEALGHFSEALRLDPKSAVRHNNLGHSLVSSGRVEEGIRHLRDALVLDPAFPDAHLNLARALTAQEHLEEAVRHYRAALRLAPDWPPPMWELAFLLATARDPGVVQPEEAVRLAERAVTLSRRQNAAALDALAAAYAAAERFDEAVDAEEAAIAVAVSTGAPQIADQLRSRLETYRRRLPVRDQRPISPRR